MKQLYSYLTKAFITISLLFAVISAHSQSFEDFLPKQKLKDGTITMNHYKSAFAAYCKAYNADADGYYLSNGVKTRLPMFKQYKRWEWFWEQRVDALTGEFPKTSIAELYEKYLKENPDVTDTEYGNWISKGPNQSSGGYAGIGRINCIAFHPANPDVFWVGSPSGGLWRTDDGGNSWINLNDNEDVLGVSDIVIPSDYETSGTIYIATGDRDHGSLWSLGGTHYENNSIGVLKSTDFGNSWTELTLSFYVSQAATTNRLLMDPQNNNILYAATSDGLYKTIDAGSNWDKRTDTEFIDMEFKPGNSSVIHASTRYLGQIWLSNDFGNNWQKKHETEEGYRTELAVSPANPSRVYAVVSNEKDGLKGVWRSVDSGLNYNVVYSEPTISNGNHNLLHRECDPGTKEGGQGYYDLSIAVDPLNENILYVGGINTWKSENGGSSFAIINHWISDCSASVEIVHADKHCLAFQNNTTLFECNDGGVYKTTNGGTTWQDLTNGIVISQIYRIGVSQSQSGTVICGLQDNGTKGTWDNNWDDRSYGDGMDCMIDYQDYLFQYMTDGYSGIFYRLDFHTSTTKDITPKKPDNTYYKGAWVSPIAMNPVDPKTIFIGLRDTLWKSTNRGDNWMHISFEELFPSPDTIHSISIAPGDTNIIYVASFNKIFKTTDGGTSWTDVSVGLPTNINITNLEVSHTNPNYVWATFGGYGANNIWFSTGEGAWINISAGLPQLPIMSVVENKLSETLELYVGTDRGVYCRTNGQWVPFMQSLPNVVVTELEIFYDDENPANSRLYAGTYGRGLWVSPLLGTEYTLSILSPETSAPAYINFNNPSASAIPVQIKIRDNNNKPITGLSMENFKVRIGGENAVINGITYDQLSKRYSLNIVPPTLTEPGNYSLEVELIVNDITISESNLYSVIYIESEFNLAITNLSAENPALVDYQSPSEHRFKINAEVNSNDGTFVNWLLQSNFEVTVGSAVATIYSLNVGSSFYDIEIIPPAQVNPEYYYDVQVAVKVNDEIVDQKMQAACVYYTKNILIEKGLRWLKENQYTAKGGELIYPLLSGHSIDSILPGTKAPGVAGSWQNSTGISALALNALITSGKTFNDPVYGNAISNAINFLLSRQITTGYHSGGFHEGAIQNSYGYSTPMAIVALYNACQNANLPSALKSTVTTAYNNGLNYLVQDVNEAWNMVSWRYDRSYTNQSSGDNSVNQWVYLALDKVGYSEKNIWTKIYNYQNAVKCVSGNTARVGYTNCNERPQAMTCAGLWGVHFAAVRDVPGALELRQQMLNYLEQMGINQLTNPASIGQNQIIVEGGYHYYLYALTKALNMYEQQTFAGVNWFNTIYEQIKTLKKTSTSGCYYWDDWGGQGAPMETSLAILSLQTGTVPPESKINIALNVTNKNDCLLFTVYDENGNAAGKNPNGTWYTNIPNSEWILTGNGYFELEVQLSSAENFSTEITNTCSEPVDFQLQFASYIGDDQTDIESFNLVIPDNNTMGATCFVNAIGGLNVIMINPPSVIPGMQLSPPVVAFNPVNPGAVHDFTFTVAETGGESTIKNINLFAGNLNDEFGNIIQASAFNINPLHFDSIQPGQSATVNVQLTIPGSFSVPPGLFTGVITAQASQGIYKSVQIEVGSPTVSVAPTNAIVDYTGDTLQFIISFNGMTGEDWTVSAQNAWMVADVTNGLGNDTVNVIIQPNYQNVQREGDLIIQSPDSYNQHVTVNIVQQPAPEFTVTTSASPAEGGVTSGDGLYLIFSQCTVTAVSNPGYQFSHWSENGTQRSTLASYIFMVEDDKNLVAFFVPVEDELILEPGWNLISLDVIPETSAVDSIFLSLIENNNLEIITGFQSQQGVFFDPALPSFINSLQEIVPGEGYWVKVYNADTLIVQGSKYPSGFSIDLKAGWNLVGYWEENTITPEIAFAPLISAGILESITSYDNGGLLFDPSLPAFLNTLTEVKNGMGYWVKVSEDFENFNFPSSLEYGLVAYYPFNGNADDESGNNYHGIVNGAVLTSDRFNGSNKAFIFDGINDVINLPTGSNIQGNNPRSICAWFKMPSELTNVGKGYCVYNGGTNGTGKDFTLATLNSSSTTFKLYLRRYTNDIFTGDITFVPDKWYFFVVTFDGTSNSGVKLYIDSQLQQVTGASGSTFSTPAIAPQIADYTDQTNNHYYAKGTIDDVRIYNRAITISEINQLYNEGGWPLFNPNVGLVAYYPFNGNADDESGNGMHGTIVNQHAFNNGISGTGIHLTGACQYSGWCTGSTGGHVMLPYIDFNSFDAFTISIWVNEEQMLIADGEAYISFGNTWQNCIHIAHFGTMRFNVGDQEISFPFEEADLSNWVQWALNFENGTIKAFKNGVLVGELDGVSYNITTQVQAIGRHWWGSTSTRFVGMIDEVRIYNRALSDTEMLELFQHDNHAFTCGTSTITDYDGNVYNTVQIGNQCWMKENLKTTHYSDGTALEDGTNVGDIAGDYTTKYFFDYNDDPANTLIYGKLYTWAAIMNGAASSNAVPSGVQGICPTGWHVPSDEEWKILEGEADSQYDYPDAEWNNIGYRGFDAGLNLKSTTGWNNSGNGTDLYGFSALPGGGRSYEGNFHSAGFAGYWWSSTQIGCCDAWPRHLTYDYAQIYRYHAYYMSNGFLVRCIWDSLDVQASLPSINTSNITEITEVTAICGGEVFNDGGAAVTSRGVCWNTTGSPTTVDNLTTDGAGTGQFTSQLTGLSPGTTYYVRAYATNSVGTAYGEELNFTTTAGFTCGSTLTDSRDGQTYTTVQIGSQCWMAENLNIGTRIDGVNNQTDNGAIEKFCYNNDEANCDVYGGLYQWNEMMQYTTAVGVKGICPTGWHVPSDEDWCTMTIFLDPTVDCGNTTWSGTDAGGKMKAIGTQYWQFPNAGATNLSGFTSLPNGYLSTDGSFNSLGYGGHLWSSSQSAASTAWDRLTDYDKASVHRNSIYKSTGIAVRCLKDKSASAVLPTVTTSSISNITQTTATCGGEITSDGGAPITARGVCWNTNGNLTLADSISIDGSGTGTFTSQLTGLSPGTTYYMKAYATNNVGTAYGGELNFTTTAGFTCGSTFTDSRDGQTYTTVQIGIQCWMAENLNIGTRIDGITSQTNNSTLEKYCYANNEANCDVYGGIYQWDEMMQYTTVESAQGICPQGWHLPSDAEWTALTDLLGGVTIAGGAMKETGTTHWTSPNAGATNSSGFTGLPSGHRLISGSFYDMNNTNYLWSSSMSEASKSWARYLRYNLANVSRYNYSNTYGFSVRCLRDAQTTLTNPSVTTASISEIDQTTAFSGGEVTSDGGTQVTARGVCWNTSGNPTLSDSFTTDGAGTGQFTSQLTNLSPGTTYYVKAYATNGVGTAYGNDVSFSTTALNIGDEFGGGIVAYILQPGDPGYVEGEQHGLIAAPSDQGGAQWGCYGTLIPGADGTTLGTGYQNTLDIITGCGTSGIAARICNDLELNGYTDWYMPSKDELNKLYINKIAIGGFTSTYYWSSSEYDVHHAWFHDFLSGNQYYANNKSNTNNVRAVRAF